MEMEEIELRLSKQALETIGTHSLIGLAFTAGAVSPCQLKIIFRGSSIAYCSKHSGPESICIPDFVPFCIVQSILDFQKMGYTISVELDDSLED